MTDTESGAPPAENGADAGTPNAGVSVLAQFVRDLSFENPQAPDSLRASAGQPQIDIGVELNARGRPDALFEVDLKLTVKATRDNQTSFHVELLYGGLFGLTGIPENEIEPVLMIECPRFLFPFARRLIADVTSEGGFPPFLMEPIDFAAVYAARQAQGLQPAGHA